MLFTSNGTWEFKLIHCPYTKIVDKTSFITQIGSNSSVTFNYDTKLLNDVIQIKSFGIVNPLNNEQFYMEDITDKVESIVNSLTNRIPQPRVLILSIIPSDAIFTTFYDDSRVDQDLNHKILPLYPIKILRGKIAEIWNVRGVYYQNRHDFVLSEWKPQKYYCSDHHMYVTSRLYMFTGVTNENFLKLLTGVNVYKSAIYCPVKSSINTWDELISTSNPYILSCSHKLHKI